jgi:hypothetical protein
MHDFTAAWQASLETSDTVGSSYQEGPSSSDSCDVPETDQRVIRRYNKMTHLCEAIYLSGNH